MPRLSGATSRRRFLKAFRECASITKAAKIANVDRGAHYDWMRALPEYPALFAQAQEEAAQWMEDEATRRASEGILQAEWYQGKAVGTKRVFSDGLMMFLLRGLMPMKYRPAASIEVTGPGGGPLEIVERLNAARKRIEPKAINDGR